MGKRQVSMGRTVSTQRAPRARRTFHSCPIFSWQREPRTLIMRRDGYPNQDAPGRQADVHLEGSCRPASGWMGERALDSRCGENDRWEELITVTRPCAGASLDIGFPTQSPVRPNPNALALGSGLLLTHSVMLNGSAKDNSGQHGREIPVKAPPGRTRRCHPHA